MITNQEAASRHDQALPKAGEYPRALNCPSPGGSINW